MARYFGESVAASSRSNSVPLRISGLRRQALAFGIPAARFAAVLRLSFLPRFSTVTAWKPKPS